MSSNNNKNNNESNNEANKQEDSLNLFKIPRARYAERWQCISFVAPTNEKRKWKSNEAIGTYCEVCKETIPYNPRKNSKAVYRHMVKYHQDLLDEYSSKNGNNESNDRKRKNISVKKSSSQKRLVKKSKHEAAEREQLQFTKLIAIWTACALRPPSIVEDVELQNAFNFTSKVGFPLKLPSRTTNERRIDELTNELKGKILKILSEKCENFSAMSDLWSSRVMPAFMAFTVHFLSNDFQHYYYTLAVKPTNESHNDTLIRTDMQQILDEWGLDKGKMTIMLRDGGSNMMKACDDWHVPQFSCIDHSLHLVVGPFLLRKEHGTADNGQNEEHNANLDVKILDFEIDGKATTDVYSDEFTEEYYNDVTLEKVRNIIDKVRKIVKYITDSTKCKEILEQLEINLQLEQIFQISMDTRTRWSSTFKMLIHFLKLKEPISKFLEFHESPIGQKEFSDSNTKLDIIDESEWALIHGLSHLLGSFDFAIKTLSGEKYATFVTSLPVLRHIKDKINNESMFSFGKKEMESSKFKKTFYEIYGNQTFFLDITLELKSYRELLLKEFDRQFSGLDVNILWTTLLDPRFSFKSCYWKSEGEKTTARNILIQHVQSSAIALEKTHIASVNENHMSVHSVDYDSDENAFNRFGYDTVHDGMKTEVKIDTENTLKEKVEALVEQEVLSYLLETEGIFNPKFSELEWWRVNKHKYPNVAKLARKWLGVPALSSPSERVFSICDIIDTTKGSENTRISCENQVFLHNNWNR